MKLLDFFLGMLISAVIMAAGFWITGMVCALGIIIFDQSLGEKQ